MTQFQNSPYVGFHVFLGLKLETCGGFIETGGRAAIDLLKLRPPCFDEFHHGSAPGFNEYHRGDSSFNPQTHVNTTKIVARVSLNTGQKKIKYESVSFETLLMVNFGQKTANFLS